jgi:trehalose-6-phosphate synthase
MGAQDGGRPCAGQRAAGSAVESRHAPHPREARLANARRARRDPEPDREGRPPDPPRTRREDLANWARAHLADRRVVVVSNREPYSHLRERGGVRVQRNAGGLVVALDAVARAMGGVWVAHGSGSADRATADAHGRVACPPGVGAYTLRRVFLSARDHALYYSGFANGALWPLCHIAYVRPRFRVEEWERYRDVNRQFADAVLEEIGSEPALVFIQDYHLALVAKYLRAARPDLRTALFWHIPWPNPEVFRILPWREEVLDGLLSNDLVAFHIRRHADNFLDTVGEMLEARVDRERLAVHRGGQRTWVRHFPIGVPADEIEAEARSPRTASAVRALRARLGLKGCKVGIGVDRLDYTKGIPERREALERMFERHPEWVGRLCFIQIGVPSRIELAEYRNVQSRTRRIAKRINARFRRPGGPTVHLVESSLDFADLVPYYQMADLCAVTALHDGMNLVAKEYLAASPDLNGSLVLSPFTGAARELERAFIATPYERDRLADAYHAALTEPAAARRERMRALREVVLRRNIYDWATQLLDAVVSLTLRTPEPVEPAAG